MKGKTLKHKSIACSLLIIVGILIAAFTRYAGENTPYSVDYLYGVSVGLITVAIVFFIVYTIRNKNEKLRQQDLINEQDERNQMIAYKSLAVAFYYVFYGLVILFFINLFLPLSLHYVFLFFIISTGAVQLIASHYYEKKY